MKFILKFILLVAFFFNFYQQECKATHIVGGELNYRYLTALPSNNSACDSLFAYQVVVTVYRDAFNGIPPFDDPLSLKIYDGENNLATIFNKNGQLLDDQNFSIKATFVEKIQPRDVDSICTAGNVFEQIQVERMRYIDTVYVCKNSSGYQFAYLRCCRNNDIKNIVGNDGSPPGETGAVIYASAPARARNSNPIIDIDPNILICANRPLEFSNAAIDLDGDSLVYRFCNSIEGCDPNDPFCQLSYFPPFDTVQFTAGYSLDNLLGGDVVPLFIDPITGEVSARPTVLGQHVVTICVEEYRNGVFLSATRRDFQFNVLDCSIVTADFLAERKVCEGDVISFQFTDLSNDEVAVEQWIWDFGDGTISNEQNPSHDFIFGEEYEVKLVAFGANGCSDTATQIINAAELEPLSMVDSIAYCGQNSVILPLQIEGENTFSWSPGIGLNNVSIQNPVASPLVQTKYTVTVNTMLSELETCVRTADITVIPDWPVPEITLGPLAIQCDQNFSIPVEFEDVDVASWSVYEDFRISEIINPGDNQFEVFQTAESTTYIVAGNNLLCADTTSFVALQRGIFSEQNNNVLVCEESITATLVPIDLKLNSNDGILQAMITLNDSTWLTTTGEFEVEISQNESLIYEVENLSGCVLIDTLKLVLSEFPDINIIEDTIVLNRPSVLELSVDGNPDYSYNWLPSGVYDDATTQFPRATINNDILLNVNATNEDGCIASDNVFVQIIPLSCNEDLVVVPSAFSPNGDSFNDFFTVRPSPEIVELTLEIFNRWGVKVYSNTSLNASWDGLYEGQVLSTDVFGYVIRSVCESGDSFIKKGNITLIR